MQKSELIGEIATRANISKAAVGRVIDALGDVVLEYADTPGDIVLGKVGKLQISQRAERTGRNPSNGQTVKIAARRAIKLVPAKALKDALKAD